LSGPFEYKFATEFTEKLARHLRRILSTMHPRENALNSQIAALDGRVLRQGLAGTGMGDTAILQHEANKAGKQRRRTRI